MQKNADGVKWIKQGAYLSSTIKTVQKQCLPEGRNRQTPGTQRHVQNGASQEGSECTVLMFNHIERTDSMSVFCESKFTTSV